MKPTIKQVKFFASIVLATIFLTWFFYAHEKLPKPIRAATALIETPVALASGVSHYLNLGIPVYETLWAIVGVNFISSFLLIFIANKLLNKRKKTTNH